MSKVRDWLDKPAGEWNGVAPDATRGECLVMYTILIAVVLADIFLIWKDMT